MGRWLLATLILLAASPPAQAISLEFLCLKTARQEEIKRKIPQGVLQGIALVETGRHSKGRRYPWPWAVGTRTGGYWYDSKGEAIRKAKAILASGTTNVDMGCMQINYHYHRDAFPNLALAFDPGANVRYAALFLLKLHRRYGSWDEAIARYHSGTPSRGAAYRARVRRAQQKAIRLNRQLWGDG